MSVHKKLMQVRVELAHLGPQRSGHNKFAGYKYFELGDFIPQAMELFLKHGLCGVVSYAPDEATLCITDVEDSTVIVIHSPMATAALKGAHDIQNLGAVESYQRRYLWMTALELTETDPIDSAEPLSIPKKDIPQPIVKSDAQVAKEQKKVDHEIVLPDPFAIHIDTKNDTLAPEDYISILMEGSRFQIENAKNADDLKMIFQVNKSHFDKLKEIDSSQFVSVLGLFKERKEAFNGV
jgi:hypothetical protein